MFEVWEIDGDVLELLALYDGEEAEVGMREIVLGAIDPVIALGPRFDFESRTELEVPLPYAQVDLAKAWEACREDAHVCKAMLERNQTVEATLLVYKNSVGWTRFWAERFPSSECRMRFFQALVRLEEGLEGLQRKAGWRFEIEIGEALKNV